MIEASEIQEAQDHLDALRSDLEKSAIQGTADFLKWGFGQLDRVFPEKTVDSWRESVAEALKPVLKKVILERSQRDKQRGERMTDRLFTEMQATGQIDLAQLEEACELLAPSVQK